MDEKIIRRVKYIYKINSFSKNKTINTSFFNSKIFNICVLLFLIFVCIYWYLHIGISISKKDWENKKCDPKYLYISGFIKNEPDMNGLESTVHNFNNCISRGYKEAIHEYNIDLKNKYNEYKGELTYEGNMNNYYKNNIKIKQNDNEDIIKDLSLNISRESTITYNTLDNLGIYVDQLDQIMNYVYQYSKNYLTYLYTYYHNHEDGSNQAKVKIILDKHFDGPSFL